MVSSSKKKVQISDISQILHSDKFVDKFSGACHTEMLDTHESNDTDIGDQRDDALLLDVGDDSDLGNSAYVTDANFLWQDMDNYV
jgi:hypothetical protein